MKKYQRVEQYPGGYAIVSEVSEDGSYFRYLKTEVGGCNASMTTLQEMGWHSLGEFLAAMAGRGRPFREV